MDSQDSLAITQGARALLASGKARIQACDFTQALQDLSLALEQDPSLADARFIRAQVMENRDLKFALREYSALIESDPSRTEAYLARAALLRAQGDMVGAMADYQTLETMVRLAPAAAPLRLRVARERAAMYEAMGFHHGAAAEYELLAEHEVPLRAEHRRNMLRNQSRQHWKAGRFQEAADGFGRLVHEAREARREFNPFDLLWRHLSLARIDSAQADFELLKTRPPADVPHAVRTNRSGADSAWNPMGPPCPVSRWPMPVFDLMCGRITPGEFEALARPALAASDLWHPPAQGATAGLPEYRPPALHLWRAEVAFYLGQWHMINGYKYMSLHCMEVAAADTRARTFESQAAAAELARLGTTP